MELLQSLEHGVENGSWQGLGNLLLGLGPQDRTTAMTWYRNQGAALARRVLREETDWYARSGREHTRAVLAVGLASTPAIAAKEAVLAQLPRDDAWATVDDLLLRLLVPRGAEFCAELCEAASHERGSQEWSVFLFRFTLLAQHLIVGLDIPVPRGPRFAEGWVELTMGAALASRRGEPDQRSLQEMWLSTPKLVDTLEAGVETGMLGRLDGITDWRDVNPTTWSVATEVRLLVEAHPEARERLLDAVLTSLTRNESRGHQRVLTRILDGLDLSPAELRDRIAAVTSVLPTAHGVITAWFTPRLLAADLAPEDLLDVGLTILTRKEKAQRTALLKHLSALEPATPAERDAVVQLLETAAEAADTAFATRARKALDRLGESVAEQAPVTVAVEWHASEGHRTGADGGTRASSTTAADDGETWPGVVPARAAHPGREPFVPVEASAAGLAALEAATEARPQITLESAWLDAAVRFAAADLDGLRAALRELPHPHSSHPETFHVLYRWAQGTRPMLELVRTDEGWIDASGDFPSRDFGPYTAFWVRLATETVARLGTSTALLSTPARRDGTLDLADLVAAVRAAGEHGYAPCDLQLALLRLSPTDPAELTALDGLTLAPADLPPATGSAEGRRGLLRHTSQPAPLPDGVESIRRWVSAGGVPARPCTLRDDKAVAPAVSFPFLLPGTEPLADVAAHETQLVGVPVYRGNNIASWMGVIPWWPDVVITHVSRRSSLWAEPQERPRFAETAGPLGVVEHWLLQGLFTEDVEHRRLSAAAEISELAAQGRLDAGLLRDAALELLAHGRLPLARAAVAWEHVILTGGLSTVWPAMVAVVEAAASAPRLPAGLAELLRTMQAYAAAAEPHLPLPAGVRELAARKGSAKAVVEARVLVAAADTARADGGLQADTP